MVEGGRPEGGAVSPGVKVVLGGGLLAAAALRWRLGSVVPQLDLVRKFIVHRHVCFLFEGVAGDGLECLFYIDGLFGTGLEVWDVVLALTPGLGSFGGYLSVLEVDLVAEHHKGEVFWVSGTGLDQEFIPPRVQGLEGVGGGHIKHQHTAVCATIKRHAQRLETLLPRCVPDLHCYKSVVHHHFLGEKVCSYCGLVLVTELFIHVLVHERGLPHSGVSQDDDFQQHLLSRRHFVTVSVLQSGDNPTAG